MEITKPISYLQQLKHRLIILVDTCFSYLFSSYRQHRASLVNRVSSPLTSNPLNPKINTMTESAMTALMANLKEDKEEYGVNFVYKTEEQIRQANGIPLTPNRSQFDDYVGIAVENNNGNYILHLCPGGGNLCFSEEDFDDLIPFAIKTLVELNITPQILRSAIGRHTGDTLLNFQKWQEKNSS